MPLWEVWSVAAGRAGASILAGADAAAAAAAWQGGQPSLEETIDVRNAMVEATDLRQPQNLDQQLMQGFSNDVGAAMVELLQVCPCDV